MRALIRRLLLGADPAPVLPLPPARHPDLDAHNDRISQLEDLVAGLRVEIAETRMQLEAANQRQNVAVSLYEHRVDQIYRRVIEEFTKGRGEERMLSLSEEAADAKLLALISAGLETEVDLDNLRLRDMISQVLTPGTIQGALTLHGFKLNRTIARERGNAIHVAPSGEDIAIFGPYRRLAPGSYQVSMIYELEGSEPSSRHSGQLSLDIFSLARNAVVSKVHEEFGPAERDEVSPRHLTAEFDWGTAEASGLIEIRLYQGSTASIRVLAVRLDKVRT